MQLGDPVQHCLVMNPVQHYLGMHQPAFHLSAITLTVLILKRFAKSVSVGLPPYILAVVGTALG